MEGKARMRSDDVDEHLATWRGSWFEKESAAVFDTKMKTTRGSPRRDSRPLAPAMGCCGQWQSCSCQQHNRE